VLSLGLSYFSVLASYELRTFAIEKMPEALLYTYLTALRYLIALYWYFTFAVLSCSADLLEQSLSKVSEDFNFIRDIYRKRHSVTGIICHTALCRFLLSTFSVVRYEITRVYIAC